MNAGVSVARGVGVLTAVAVDTGVLAGVAVGCGVSVGRAVAVGTGVFGGVLVGWGVASTSWWLASLPTRSPLTRPEFLRRRVSNSSAYTALAMKITMRASHFILGTPHNAL